MVLALWVVAGVWLTFAFDYQITTLWSHVGLYGQRVRVVPPGPVYTAFAYDQHRVARVNSAIDLYGNIFLFTPLAVIVPLLRPRIRWWQVGVLVAVLSSGVELVQLYVGGRIAQVSDVVWNTGGTLAAFAVVILVRAAWRRRRPGPSRAATSAPATEPTTAGMTTDR